MHRQAVDGPYGSSRGTRNYPSPNTTRSHAHSAANLCPRPTTQLQARTRRAAWCAATRRRGGYCTTRWSRCSFTTSAFIHATGRVRRGKVLRRGTGGAVGQGPDVVGTYVIVYFHKYELTFYIAASTPSTRSGPCLP